jgi:integrase/recombinase XerC
MFEDWISSKTTNTRKNYLDSIKKFSGWAEDHAPELGEKPFIRLYTLSGLDANKYALRFREWMREQDLSPHTVNNRLGAMRSFATLLHAIGAIPWTFAVRDLPAETYRDTKGPGSEGIRLVLQAAKDKPAPRGIRDQVVVLMLYTLGLRTSELTSLNVEDIDFPNRRIHFRGKGRTQKEWASIPAGLYNRLLSWLEERSKYAPAGKGPLILAFSSGSDTSHKQDRISRMGIFQTVRRLGRRVGIPGLHPHAIRHSAITEVLRQNGGNIAKAMRFSRHKDPKTLMVYEDNLEDAPGKAAAGLEKEILETGKK